MTVPPPTPAANALRDDARTLFNALPWPKAEDEAWRRMDLSFLEPERFVPGATADLTPEAFMEGEATSERAGEALWLGTKIHARLSPEAEAQGVVFGSLSEALSRCPEKVLPFLGKIVPPETGKFAAWNTAQWESGLFFYVPKGVSVALPFLGGHGAGAVQGRAIFPRTLVVLEEGAQATYIEDYTALPAAGENLSSAVVEIALAANARLHYIHLQRWPAGWRHFLKQNARLDRDAALHTLVVATGGDFGRADFGSDLNAPGASARLYGLVFGDGEQRFTHHTHQNHRAPSTTSDLLFKAALRDNARSVYTGLVKIAPEAQKSNAYQASKNILLSKGARANAIPMLEILADDVKCGHGAAVGSLDDDQRFFLMSRGLSREEAERAIVEGFFEDVLQRIPVPGMPDRLRAILDAKLESRG